MVARFLCRDGMGGNVLIANEQACWGGGGRSVRRSVEYFEGRGYEFSLLISEKAGHARQLAATAASEGAETVVVIGGDGTVNEVVNGMLASGVDNLPRVGIIPAGSSNDLAKSLGIPQKLEQACEAIIEGRTRLIDVGQVGSRYFCMASTIGLLADVAAESFRISHLRGAARYLAAAMRIIRKIGDGWEMCIEAGGRTFRGNYAALLLSNARRFGGLTFAPEAKCDDGLFDCLLVEIPTKREALHLISLVLRKGLNRHKKVTAFQAKSLSVSLDRPARLCNDGEVYSEDFREICYRVLPRRLELFC